MGTPALRLPTSRSDRATASGGLVVAGASDVSGLPGVRAGAGVLLGTFLLALGSVLCIALLFGGGACTSSTAAWSQQARREIPRRYIAFYEAAGARFRVSPFFLAAIGWIESRQGRDPAAFVVNPSGCVGPMELGVGGACGDFVGHYGIDADRDGRIDPTNPADAIFTAANGLRQGGLPPLDHTTLDDYRRAACGYYGACAGYADAVLERARAYGGPGWLIATAGSGCAGTTAGAGAVRIAPGANLPGKPIQAPTLEFLRRVAALVGHPITVTTGTNHSKYTVDGVVSDHFYGYAADFGISTNGGVRGGNRICAAGLVAAGDRPVAAASECHRGGLYTRYRDGLRIQVIWKTYEGGDHFDHVHIGARPL
jgi:hypothetical protein